MYNGIGLSTTRGSGTNGFVQKNMGFVVPKAGRRVVSTNSGVEGKQSFSLLSAPAQAAANKELLDHRKKRMIEAKVFEFTESLLEKGLTAENVQKQSESYRERLMRENSDYGETSKDSKLNSHIIGENKKREDKKLRSIFRIDDDFVEGSSFDPVAIDEKRKKRSLEWELSHGKREDEGQLAGVDITDHVVSRTADNDNDDDGNDDQSRKRPRHLEEQQLSASSIPMPVAPPEPTKPSLSSSSRRGRRGRSNSESSDSSSSSSSSESDRSSYSGSSSSSSRSSSRSRRSRRRNRSRRN